MGLFWLRRDRVRGFRRILVHPTQEIRDVGGSFFRGGPDWPYFPAQVLPRHCWGAKPRPVDAKPLPAIADWPYFEPRLFPVFWPQLCPDPDSAGGGPERAVARLADAYAPASEQVSDTVDVGFWCGPIVLHFGHMIADFGMRIAASSELDRDIPLVFSLPPLRDLEPPSYFWEMIDHLGIDRHRVVLIRKPTRFGMLYVLPQAERPFGGAPSAQHLALMDAITTRAAAATGPEIDTVFVSRARLDEGRFAGEAFLEQALAAAGITVFHPETASLPAQLDLYRRARRLIFSEGSAVHALQLFGHLDCYLVVLARRPGNAICEASLRPRVRSLHYLQAVRGLVHGLAPSGLPLRRAGISLLDEAALLADFASMGIALDRFWDPRAYAQSRDADIAAWIEHRLQAGHPEEPAVIEQQLRELELMPDIAR